MRTSWNGKSRTNLQCSSRCLEEFRKLTLVFTGARVFRDNLYFPFNITIHYFPQEFTVQLDRFPTLKKTKRGFQESNKRHISLFTVTGSKWSFSFNTLRPLQLKYAIAFPHHLHWDNRTVHGVEKYTIVSTSQQLILIRWIASVSALRLLSTTKILKQHLLNSLF